MRRNPSALAALALVAACSGLAEPDVPNEVVIGGARLRAELTVIRTSPTEVRLRVLATNVTGSVAGLWFSGPPCSVTPVVYGHPVSAVVPPPGPCGSIPGFLDIEPGETASLPDEPQFVVRDVLGEAFEPERYFITARLFIGPKNESFENVELGTRTIRVR